MANLFILFNSIHRFSIENINNAVCKTENAGLDYTCSFIENKPKVWETLAIYCYLEL